MLKSIIILVVMALVNAALMFAILRLVKRTDNNLQKFFLDKTSDFLSVEERVVIEEENNSVVTNNEEIKKIETQYIVNDIDRTSYRDSDFKNNYKSVKEEMNFDRSSVIKEVIRSNKDDEDEFSESIRSIDRSFDFDTIYQLSTVSSEIQLSILNGVFDYRQKQFLHNYIDGLGSKKFDVVTFFNYVKEQAKLVDEKFYIKTGSSDEKYDNLGDNIITIHDENIVEGIQVVHKNKIYDYSI